MTSRTIIPLFLLVSFLTSSCSVLTNQYSYNASRGGNGQIEERRPDAGTARNPVPTSAEPKQKDTTRPGPTEAKKKKPVPEKVPVELPEKIAKPDEITKRQGIADYAQTYVGTKYKYGGKTPDGFDCSGFTSHVMKEYDVKLPGNSASQSKMGKKTNLKKAQAGDLVYFRRSPAGKVFHIAIVVSNGKEGTKIAHSTSRGVVVDNLSRSDYWRPKISGVRDVIGD